MKLADKKALRQQLSDDWVDIDRRRFHGDRVEAYNRLDTVAYHQSAVEASTENTATTRLNNPPDGTLISVFAILIAGIIFYLPSRKEVVFLCKFER